MSRPRRASSRRIVDDDSISEEETYSEREEEEEEPPVEGAPGSRRRRLGKAPVDEDDDDYVPGPGDNAAEEQEEEEAGDLQKDAEINAAGPSGGRLTSGRRRQSRAGATKRQRTQAVAHQANGASNEPLTPLLISQADINRLSAKLVEYKNESEACLNRLAGSLGITAQGRDALVRLVIRHVLFSNTDRPGVPIPRADLTKLISQNTTSRKQIASYILALAQHNMVELFGLDMMELTRPPVARGKDRRLGTTAEGAKQFVLRSLVPGNMYAAVVDSRREDAQRGLLIVILGLLQVATNGELVEDELWRLLKELGVDRKRRDHPTLGAPETLVEEFVKRRQLKVVYEQGPNGREAIYGIGEVAAHEVGEDKLKTFIESEVMGM